MFALFGFKLVVGEDLGVNALVLARGNELLRHLEKRIRMEQDRFLQSELHFLSDCWKTCKVRPGYRVFSSHSSGRSAARSLVKP